VKKLRVAIAILALLAAVVVVFREPLRQALYDTVTADMFVTGDRDGFDPGPAIGSHFPGVNATYRGREIRLLEEFAGPHGTVFLATRSADWCPYCMKQMIQLQEHIGAYREAGIGVVAMTYDDPALQAQFVEKWGIEYPLLHDVQTLSFRTLGILNEAYRPDDSAYGIPHPGMIVIDPDGLVVGKLFLEDYSVRVDAQSSLAYAKNVLGLETQAPAATQASSR
jgi:peroxiredoxin